MSRAWAPGGGHRVQQVASLPSTSFFRSLSSRAGRSTVSWWAPRRSFACSQSVGDLQYFALRLDPRSGRLREVRVLPMVRAVAV
ncbi:MAG: hypothetical protein HY557_06850 [Euryarchaeota archaeon]|nr:hypothetical protein [Euryarchaeota archaeon]